MTDDVKTARLFQGAAAQLRQARARLVQMVSDSHVVKRCWPEVSVVLCDGISVARSLEHLAGLLDEVGR
jgi:hypothetical protein